MFVLCHIALTPLLPLTPQSTCSQAWGASSIHQTHRILGQLCSQLGCQEAGWSRSSNRWRCSEWSGGGPRWGGRGDRSRRPGEPGRADHWGRGVWRRRRRKGQQQLLQICLARRRQPGHILQVELCHQQAGRAEDQGHDQDQLAAREEGIRRIKTIWDWWGGQMKDCGGSLRAGYILHNVSCNGTAQLLYTSITIAVWTAWTFFTSERCCLIPNIVITQIERSAEICFCI